MRFFRVTIKGLLLISLIVAAYFAGRAPWEQAARLSSATALRSEEEKRQISMAETVWREIACDCRDDLRRAQLNWSRHLGSRFGHGGSYVWSPNSDSIVPRYRRWRFELSDDPATALDQQGSIGALLVGIWRDPARIARWDVSTGQFMEIDESLHIEDWQFLAGDRIVFGALPDSILTDSPSLVLLAIPPQAESMIAIVELERLRDRGSTIGNVAETTFGFTQVNSLWRLEIRGQSFKTTTQNLPPK